MLKDEEKDAQASVTGHTEMTSDLTSAPALGAKGLFLSGSLGCMTRLFWAQAH